MDWLVSTGQAVLDSISQALSMARNRTPYYGPGMQKPLKLKSLLQASLLVTPSSSGQPGPSSTSCPNAQLSCHNTTAADTCCLSYPGGLMLQTQFWDTNPPVGPSDSWTIHGLWPDLCDGGYDAYCDNARKYTNISAILTAGGAVDVLSYMQKYWKDYQGDDEDLWSHEWSKHGTCVSTMETKCYTNYRAQQEVVDYFNATTALFKVLPTYETLAAAGVLPSNSRTWMAEEIEIPLKKMHGKRVTLRCRNKMLDEVWYHFSVRGPVQTGDFLAAEPDGAKSNCPGTGIRYLPKSSSGGSSRTIEPTASQPVTSIPSPTSTAAPFTGKGYLEVLVKGDTRPQGCLISQGGWYVGGTCARFQIQDHVVNEHPTAQIDQPKLRMFTMHSSKGSCGIVGHKLQCSKNLATPAIFSTTSNGTLSYDKHTSFYAKAVPPRFHKGDVFTVKPTGSDVIELEMIWSRIGFTN